MRADEVQVRKGNYVGEDKSKVDLLLFADARACMDILDETVGEFGWSCNYKEEKGVMLCGIAIKDPVSGAYIWKYDAGGDGNIEPEKSVASSSFKRAAARWGISRSLYSSPRIVVPNEPVGYKCTDIGYENHKIVRLTIVNSRGDEVFHFENGKSTVKAGKSELPEVDRQLPWLEQLLSFCTLKKDQTEDPEEHIKLRAFYSYYKAKDKKGLSYGPAKCYKFFLSDVKDGTIEIDDADPKHPKAIWKGRKE